MYVLCDLYAELRVSGVLRHQRQLGDVKIRYRMQKETVTEADNL